ncbi:MAG: LPP20 family lipoprotein [Sphaerochaetaceae bacterium]|nr:LPP20 family lipoprotein [Sphaerochaetaceae bacterium]
MKKCLIFTLSVFLLMLTLSCASHSNHKIALSQNKGVKGKNGIERPDWVVRDFSDSETLYAAAYGRGSTFEVSLKKARVEADGELAQYVNNTVTKAVNRSYDETEDAEILAYLDSFSTDTNTVGKAILSGVKEEDFWEDNEGGVWILVSIPAANVKAQMEKAISETSVAVPSPVKTKKTISVLSKNLDEVLTEK